jgi:Protein of unknown function (DUF2815)
MKVSLKNVRLSFPDLFKPRAFKPGDEPKHKATFLIPNGDPQIKVVETAILEAAKAKWGAKAEAVVKSIRGNPNKFCFQDGNTKDYDGYADMMALSANNKARPLVIDQRKNPLTEADGKPYAGCYVNATVEVFCYDNSGNGISASLKGVQFAGDGDAFSGSAPASPDDFDEIAEGSAADDLV